jgi:hypothetical protein
MWPQTRRLSKTAVLPDRPIPCNGLKPLPRFLKGERVRDFAKYFPQMAMNVPASLSLKKAYPNCQRECGNSTLTNKISQICLCCLNFFNSVENRGKVSLFFIIYPGSVNPSTKSQLLFNKIKISTHIPLEHILANITNSHGINNVAKSAFILAK